MIQKQTSNKKINELIIEMLRSNFSTLCPLPPPPHENSFTSIPLFTPKLRKFLNENEYNFLSSLMGSKMKKKHLPSFCSKKNN